MSLSYAKLRAVAAAHHARYRNRTVRATAIWIDGVDQLLSEGDDDNGAPYRVLDKPFDDGYTLFDGDELHVVWPVLGRRGHTTTVDGGIYRATGNHRIPEYAGF